MLDTLIADIKRAHRDHCYHMSTRQMIDGRLGSHIRTTLGWQKTLPEKERKRIEAEAARIMAAEDVPPEFARMVLNARKARPVFEEDEAIAEKRKAGLAETLPVWKEFGESVRGFGAASLAAIVAEAGDLSRYDGRRGESKLWKRMGLAPGQNRVPPNLSREARSEAWISRKYSPIRRARMYVIGDSLIKAQVRQVKDADGKDTGERTAIGPYGEVYLRRKAHTQQSHPEWWCDKDGKPKLDKAGRPVSAHGNFDAHRYLEKRLLRDLWRAWRRTSGAVAERPKHALPSAHLIAAE